LTVPANGSILIPLEGIDISKMLGSAGRLDDTKACLKHKAFESKAKIFSTFNKPLELSMYLRLAVAS